MGSKNRRKYHNYVRGIHVTRNVVKGRVRFTYHFPSGVVFHSFKGSYPMSVLRSIDAGTHVLSGELRESYSQSPAMVRDAAEAFEAFMKAQEDRANGQSQDQA